MSRTHLSSGGDAPAQSTLSGTRETWRSLEYHFLVRKGRFTGELGSFLDVFIAGRADAYGSWDAHVASSTAGWRGGTTTDYGSLRGHARRLRLGSRRILRFLEVDVAPDRVALVVERNSFRNMRTKELTTGRFASMSNSGASPLVRVGTAKQWETELKPSSVRGSGRGCRSWSHGLRG